MGMPWNRNETLMPLGTSKSLLKQNQDRRFPVAKFITTNTKDRQAGRSNIEAYHYASPITQDRVPYPKDEPAARARTWTAFHEVLSDSLPIRLSDIFVSVLRLYVFTPSFCHRVRVCKLYKALLSPVGYFFLQTLLFSLSRATTSPFFPLKSCLRSPGGHKPA